MLTRALALRLDGCIGKFILDRCPSSDTPNALPRFAYVTTFAAQTTAATSLVQFNYDDVLRWGFGINISPVLWIFISLLVMISINFWPVRVCTLFLASSDIQGLEKTNRLKKFSLGRYMERLNTGLGV